MRNLSGLSDYFVVPPEGEIKKDKLDCNKQTLTIHKMSV